MQNEEQGHERVVLESDGQLVRCIRQPGLTNRNLPMLLFGFRLTHCEYSVFTQRERSWATRYNHQTDVSGAVPSSGRKESDKNRVVQRHVVGRMINNVANKVSMMSSWKETPSEASHVGGFVERLDKRQRRVRLLDLRLQEDEVRPF